MTMTSQSVTKSEAARWFYSGASLLLLVLTFVGFKLFYLHLQAFPGRPLPPPIRMLLMIHGIMATVWMLLAVVQPVLVATRRKRVHMALGMFGVVLAVGIVVTGYLVAVNAARVNPPDLQLFGRTPKQFLTVPLSAIFLFATFVTAGVLFRRRPEVHRPMMMMASVAVVSAALGRMPVLNDWYAGTWWEDCFSGFLTTVGLGALLVALKGVMERRWDRWFATAFGVLTVVYVGASLVAKTSLWGAVATRLIG